MYVYRYVKEFLALLRAAPSQNEIAMSPLNDLVKMTLRSAAYPWRALAKHLAGTCISFGTLQSHLCFAPITFVVHLFLSSIHTSFTGGSLDQQSVQWILLDLPGLGG